MDETGPLLALHLGYLQPKPRGLLFGYAGRLYFGDVDYEGATLSPPFMPLGLLDELGYDGWIGCEYQPRGRTGEGLGWAGAYGIGGPAAA